MFEKYKRHCQDHAMGVWNSTPNDLVTYLQGIYRDNKSVSSVYQNLSSIAYFYKLKGLESPSNGHFVSMYMKGLKRQHLTLSAPVARAKPITIDHLKALIDHLADAPRPGLRIWRTVWRMNVAFYCMLRWDDVCRLKVLF